MKNYRIIIATVLAMPLIMILGCGSGGTSTYGASSAQNKFTIVTMESAGPPSEAWPNAIITGQAVPGTYSCTAGEDSNCIVGIGYNILTNELDPGDIPSFNTGDLGEVYFGTNAVDGQWSFDAKTDPQDVGVEMCTASITIPVPYEVNYYVPLVCGSHNAEMVATPSSCNRYTNGTTDCPASVTLSFSPTDSASSTLPVAIALAAVNYNSSGNNVAQNSVTATSTTSVVVPTPTTTGINYVAVSDTTTGQVIGVAEFTIHVSAPPGTGGGGGGGKPGGGCTGGSGHCTN